MMDKWHGPPKDCIVSSFWGRLIHKFIRLHIGQNGWVSVRDTYLIVWFQGQFEVVVIYVDAVRNYLYKTRTLIEETLSNPKSKKNGYD